MSYPITDVIGLTPLTVASTSYTPDLSSLPTSTDDDYVILCVVSSATSGTLSVSGTGWSEQIELDVAVGGRMAVYYCKVASGAVATPTITLSAGTSAWQCAAWVERDADATTLFDNAVSYDPSANVTSAASASYTPGSNDCRIIWFGSARNSGSTPNLRMLEVDAVGELIQSSYDGSVGTCISIGSAVQDTAASTIKSVYRSVSGRIGVITLGIKNKSGGKRAASASAGLSRVSWCGNFGDAHDGALTPVRSSRNTPTSRTINSIAVSGTVATFTANASGPSVWGSWDQYATAVSGGWQGTMFTYSADIDMSGQLFTVEFYTTVVNIFNDEGLIVVLEDNGSTNWNAYQLTKNYGWRANALYTGIIDITNQTPYDSGGTLDLTQVRKISFLVHRLANTTSRSFYIRHLNLLSNTTLTGGNSASPQTINYIRKVLQGWSCDRLVGGDAPAVTLKSDVQIGDGGTTVTYFDATGTLLTFPATFDPITQREWMVGANQIDVTINAGASDTINLTANTLATTSAQNLTIDASSSTSATYSAIGASVVGPWDVTWKTGVDCTGATFSGCGVINFKGANVTSCTITDTVSTDAAIAFDASSATVTGTTIDVTGTSADYHLELGTAVTAITLTDVTFTGTPGTDKVHVLKTSGTVTITVAGTTNLVSGDVTSAGATVVIVAPSESIEFTGLISGSQVKVFAAGTTTELFSTNSSGTSETTGALTVPVDVDYTIMKAGYEPIRVAAVTISGAISFPIQQPIDRAYAASSGLTYGTNCSVNLGTKKFGLTVPSTLQNFYSYMIEQWISNAALKNQDFPITPNGSASFSFDLGWEWDGSTSIGHLSRDGMRYTDGGTVTAMWAALLSVGVPAGMQVRYQQQDGLGTTNAQATGNIDQLIQIYGDAAHGNFDYTDWLVLKVQAEGYDQAEAVVLDIYPALDDQLFVVGLTPLANGIAAQAGITGVTITAEPTPVLWNGQYFSTTITDTTDAHSGLQVMQYVRHLNDFNLHDLIRPNGAKFKTVTGNVYGDALTTPAGVRVVKADGTTPHPDFDLFIADSGSSYSPPVTAPITWAGALDDTTVLLYNDSDAGAIIDTQVVSGAGGYVWSISLPHADVAVGDSLRLRFGHKEYYAGELQGTMTASGLAFVGAMTLHPVYAGWALDGADYDQANGGPYTMDGTNLEVDIAAGATTGLKTQLAAWTQYLMTLPAGLDAFYGAWDLLAVNQIRQNVAVVDVMIDVPTAGALFTFTDNNVNYYRSDFTFPGNVQAGHGLVAMTYNASIFVPPPTVISGESVVTGTAAEIIAAIPSAAMIANEVINVAIVP